MVHSGISFPRLIKSNIGFHPHCNCDSLPAIAALCVRTSASILPLGHHWTLQYYEVARWYDRTNCTHSLKQNADDRSKLHTIDANLERKSTNAKNRSAESFKKSSSDRRIRDYTYRQSLVVFLEYDISLYPHPPFPKAMMALPRRPWSVSVAWQQYPPDVGSSLRCCSPWHWSHYYSWSLYYPHFDWT